MRVIHNRFLIGYADKKWSNVLIDLDERRAESEDLLFGEG